MTSGSRLVAVLDTSVLVNFLVVDRMDLLTAHPVYRFALTTHVRGEVTDYYPGQLARFVAALAGGGFDEVAVEATNPHFVQLTQSRRLGVGEAAAIAHAIEMSVPLAIDDKTARNAALTTHPAIVFENTETLTVLAIRNGQLDVATADGMKEDWERRFRFKLLFASFAEKLASSNQPSPPKAPNAV